MSESAGASDQTFHNTMRLDPGEIMVPRGIEPRTLRLLAVRSNQLSYETSWHCGKKQLRRCVKQICKTVLKDIDLAVFGLPSSLVHKGADLALIILPGVGKNDRIAWNHSRSKGFSRSNEKYVPVKDDCFAQWELAEKCRKLFTHTHTHPTTTADRLLATCSVRLARHVLRGGYRPT